jgi:hypothetical protein
MLEREEGRKGGREEGRKGGREEGKTNLSIPSSSPPSLTGNCFSIHARASSIVVFGPWVDQTRARGSDHISWKSSRWSASVRRWRKSRGVWASYFAIVFILLCWRWGFGFEGAG